MLFIKSTVCAKVNDKMKKKSLDYILIQAYEGALPFDEEFTHKRRHEVARFAYTVLESIDAWGMLEKAIESETDVRKNHFLRSIRDICLESARAVENRLSQSLDDTDSSGDEIIKGADFNEIEKKCLVNNVKKLDLGTISSFIEDKVINEISEEKKAYQAEEFMKKNIKDKLEELDEDVTEDAEPSDGSGEAAQEDAEESVSDEAVEAFIRHNTHKNDARGHVSLFSTIQTSVLESLMCTRENYKTFNFSVIKPITLEFFGITEEIDSLSKIERAVENSINLCDPSFSSISPEKMQKLTLINTITVYTLLQTLYTLGLLRPSVNDVRDFIINRRPVSVTREEQVKNISGAINKQLHEIPMELVKTKTPGQVECVQEKLARLKSAIMESQCGLNKTDLCSQIETIEESCNKKIADITESMTAKPIDLDDRKRINDIATLNRLNTVYGHKKDIQKLLVCPYDKKSADIKAVSRLGEVVSESVLNLQKDYWNHNITMESYIKSLIMPSNLSMTDLEVYFKENGQERRIK